MDVLPSIVVILTWHQCGNHHLNHEVLSNIIIFHLKLYTVFLFVLAARVVVAVAESNNARTNIKRQKGRENSVSFFHLTTQRSCGQSPFNASISCRNGASGLDFLILFALQTTIDARHYIYVDFHSWCAVPMRMHKTNFSANNSLN